MESVAFGTLIGEPVTWTNPFAVESDIAWSALSQTRNSMSLVARPAGALLTVRSTWEPWIVPADLNAGNAT
jgi:hypothetical protein